MPDLTLEGVTANWHSILDFVRSENPMLGAVVTDARPVSLEGEDSAPVALSEDELVARLLDEFDAEVLGGADEEGR